MDMNIILLRRRDGCEDSHFRKR